MNMSNETETEIRDMEKKKNYIIVLRFFFFNRYKTAMFVKTWQDTYSAFCSVSTDTFVRSDFADMTVNFWQHKLLLELLLT